MTKMQGNHTNQLKKRDRQNTSRRRGSKVQTSERFLSFSHKESKKEGPQRTHLEACQGRREREREFGKQDT